MMPSSTSAAKPCKLCHHARQLRKSHIIPECLYRPVYDAKHRALHFQLGDARPRLAQLGLTERLLCDDCEQAFGRLERPLCAAIRAHRFLPARLPTGRITLDNLDYSGLKLFALSVVWRASVSSLYACAQVSLGPHENVIRQMLLTGDAGPWDRYPVYGLVLRVPDEPRPATNFIMPPCRTRKFGVRTYVFAAAGCAWHVVVSSHDPNDKRFHTIALGTSGRLVMDVVPITDYDPLRRFMRARGTTGR
jgi:hypothetical protein